MAPASARSPAPWPWRSPRSAPRRSTSSPRSAGGRTSSSCSRSSTTCPTRSTSTSSAAAEHLLPQPRPARDHAQAEPRGRRHRGHGVVRSRAVHLEVAARRVRLHRVRALLQLLPGLQHRQAAVADAPHPRRARRDDRARHRCRCDRSSRRSSATPRSRARHGDGARDGHGARPRTPEGAGIRWRAARRGSSTSCRRSSAGASRTRPCGPAPPAAPARRSARSSSTTRARSSRCARTWCSPSARMPAELARTFTNLERNSNPWGIGADKRMDWAEGLDVPTVDDQPERRVPAVRRLRRRLRRPHQEDDARAGRGAAARRGVDFAVLGQEEQCTGDPARRAGNEMLYQMQAEANVETMNAAKVKQGRSPPARTASTPSRTSTRSSAATSRSSTTRS